MPAVTHLRSTRPTDGWLIPNRLAICLIPCELSN
jgi:hypothetical protein